MNIMIVDDESLALGDLMEAVGQVCADSDIHGFRFAEEALDYLAMHRVDVAFLDIAMPEINGLELARRVKETQRETNIIFVTAYSEYALDAHKLYVTGYLMKPASQEDIRGALENLRNPVRETERYISVRTFGGFEVCVNGEPISFGRSKAKELLAYLVDRKGFASTMQQLIVTLWDDAEATSAKKSHLRNLIAEMLSVLKEAGAEEMIVKGFNSLSIDTKKFQCDYYDFLEWKLEGINAYTSEYMPEYSWAEFTLGMLEERLREKKTNQ